MTKEETKKYFMNIREAIIALEKELCDDISEDGTLTVNVEDSSKVSRVLVCDDNHFCGLYYPEQEPSEDAVKYFDNIYKLSQTCGVTYDFILDRVQEIETMIKTLPPVTPQPKMGQWIKKEHEICFTCNQCWVTNASGVMYNYCPNCGAKMEVQNDT